MAFLKGIPKMGKIASSMDAWLGSIDPGYTEILVARESGKAARSMRDSAQARLDAPAVDEVVRQPGDSPSRVKFKSAPDHRLFTRVQKWKSGGAQKIHMARYMWNYANQPLTKRK